MDRSNDQMVILGKSAQGKSSAALAATPLEGSPVRSEELVELRRGPIFVFGRNGARQIKVPRRPEDRLFRQRL